MHEFNFANPDEMGSSEYRALCDCLQSGLEDCPAEERTELAAAMLEEFVEHAAAMLWCEQSCRSRIGACANGQLRFSRNLGDPVVSSMRSRLERPGEQIQA